METTAGFRHEALFYAGQDDFLARSGSFLRAGLDAAEPALVVLSTHKIEALRAELADHAGDVEFADMAEVGRNPARIIQAWGDFVARHPSRRLRGIGEPIWAERSRAELVECQRHESLLNLAFADAHGFHLLCPYDTTTLPDAVLYEACRSHPHVAGDVGPSDRPGYRSIDDAAAPLADPLPEPLSVPQSRVFQAGTLGGLRQFVHHHASAAGFAEDAAEDLVLAVHEVASNSVVHGGGGGVLRIWQEDEAMICEVNDRGVIRDPLAGRRRPPRDQLGGAGLWMANGLCDLVQIRTFADGSAVRLHKRRG